jgi:hypothetical protein
MVIFLSEEEHGFGKRLQGGNRRNSESWVLSTWLRKKIERLGSYQHSPMQSKAEFNMTANNIRSSVALINITVKKKKWEGRL